MANEPTFTMPDALRLVLMFHDGAEWNAGKRAEWRRITGDDQATTKVLCWYVRAALEISCRYPPSEAEESLMRVCGLAVGRVLDAADVEAIKRTVQELDDEVKERLDAKRQGREEVLREIGGQELVDLDATDLELMCDAAADKAMKIFRERLAKRRTLS